METRVFSHDACLLHRAPAGYPECPERLSSVLEGLERSISVDRGADPEEGRVDRAILALQDADYVRRLRAAVERGDGLIDSADNPLGPETWRAAKAAVAVALRSLDWTMERAGRRAFAAVRPPGHHAGRDYAMGFCYLSNIAIAAQHLLDGHGLSRVAILDFDVHHGNGTQDAFYDRGEVFFLSVHQHPFYPGTGLVTERGQGEGAGATLNVNLPAGSGDDDYAEVFAKTLEPALDDFRPQALLISAGFDAWVGDPLGGMRVTEAGFEDWGRRLSAVADRHCDGRLWSIQEGGYDVPRLGDLVVAYLRGQSGSDLGKAGR